ncbi:MAG: glycosyltransferase family 2 protein [Sedimentitalea sp.]
MTTQTIRTIGVVVVTYTSNDVITGCLDSLMTSSFENIRVMVCDNASPDDTTDCIRDWAARTGCDFAEDAPEQHAKVTLINTGANKGFAGGVNDGLRALMAQDDVDLFWVLNPDCEVTSDTAAAFARAAEAAGPFSLMGGRILYTEGDKSIQSDGGNIGRRTGICRNVNQGLLPDQATAPTADALDYIAGANMVASRAFLDSCGLLTEDYFLYYEEVDWAFKRGDLPLVFSPDAFVFHHNGTSIGSGSVSKRASPFSNYFNYRNRIWFVRRHFPSAFASAYTYSLLKILKLTLIGAWDEASAAFRGLHTMAPPKAIRDRLSEDAHALAFGPGPRAD